MQYEVFENGNKKARSEAPFIVVLQSDFSRGAQTVIVVPLVRRVHVRTEDRITLAVVLNGEPFAVQSQAMAAVRINGLGRAVGALPDLAERMPRAIDFLFLGL